MTATIRKIGESLQVKKIEDDAKQSIQKADIIGELSSALSTELKNAAHENTNLMIKNHRLKTELAKFSKMSEAIE